MKRRSQHLAQEASAYPRPLARRVKIVDEIIETIRHDIVTRKLAEGERLPTEKELSERFRVSQPTVREAVRALETLGLVDVLHGSGSFVRGQTDYALASALQTLIQLQSVSIMDVLDIRQVLGRHSIERASQDATPEDIEAIALAEAKFSQLGLLKAVNEIFDCIIGFQRAVSAASHNPILHSLESVLLALLHEVQVESLSAHGLRFWRTRALEFQPHRLAILDGLRSRNAKAAREAMDRYFKAQRARFEQDRNLRSINLGSPRLVTVISDMVRQSRD